MTGIFTDAATVPEIDIYVRPPIDSSPVFFPLPQHSPGP